MIIGLSIAGVVLLGFAAYTFLTRGTVDDGLVTEQTAPVGQEVIRLLNELSAIHIDKTVIQSQAYQSLVDYSVPVAAEPVGKTNPFGAIGQ